MGTRQGRDDEPATGCWQRLRFEPGEQETTSSVNSTKASRVGLLLDAYSSSEEFVPALLSDRRAVVFTALCSVTARASSGPVAAAGLGERASDLSGCDALRARQFADRAAERRRAQSLECLGACRHDPLVREQLKDCDTMSSGARRRPPTITFGLKLAIAMSAGRISNPGASLGVRRVSRTLPADAALVERTF